MLKLVCDQMEELHCFIMGVDYEAPEDTENTEAKPKIITTE
jgi:hypothetical protein